MQQPNLLKLLGMWYRARCRLCWFRVPRCLCFICASSSEAEADVPVLEFKFSKREHSSSSPAPFSASRVARVMLFVYKAAGAA